MISQTQFDTLPGRRESHPGLVAVAMSGGVDSSTVAAVLLQGAAGEDQRSQNGRKEREAGHGRGG